MLTVPAILQAEGECGNTSLAAVARFFGRAESPADFAKAAGTTIDGTDHGNMVAAAKAMGARARAKATGTIAELAASVMEGVPPIVGWWSLDQGDGEFDRRWSLARRKRKDCGHYSVVKGVTETHVVLMDPQEGPSGGVWDDHAFTHEAWMRVWHDTDTPRYRPVRRWWMAMWW
jgi:ABC-type bacteriocin/lantibiotic exporter with double-glycine peptidase domain